MTSKAEKLLRKMRNSQTNWNRVDLEKLYEGFGFIIVPGGNHDKVTHPDFPQLFTSLPRHNRVHKYLVIQAIQLVDKYIELRGENDDQ